MVQNSNPLLHLKMLSDIESQLQFKEHSSQMADFFVGSSVDTVKNIDIKTSVCVCLAS